MRGQEHPVRIRPFQNGKALGLCSREEPARAGGFLAGSTQPRLCSPRRSSGTSINYLVLVCGQGMRGTSGHSSGVGLCHCGTAELLALVESLQRLRTGALWGRVGCIFPPAESWHLAACRSEMLAKGWCWWDILPFVSGGVSVFGTSPPVQAALQTLAPRPGEGQHVRQVPAQCWASRGWETSWEKGS